MEPMWCDVRRHFCRCDDRCDDDIYDDDEDYPVVNEMTEDQRLDDPRHGQAEDINRKNRERR